MTGPDVDPDDVILEITHSHRTFETTLREWMANGPGPRPLCHPISARSRRTGQPLSLAVVPPSYRNDPATRARIAAGELEWPWPQWPFPAEPST
jgi:hypothetical protein